MYVQSKPIAFLLIASIAIFSVISLKLLSPPAVVPSSEGEERFSAERGLIFLSVIAQEPHVSGSPAHARVRDYIYTYCQRMGLETELMDQTGMNIYPKFIRAGQAQNIVARLKGTQPGKTILVMSHYDSQPNTPGATDDGAGVAAMMEAIRLLKNSPALKNDVLFLFTDLEESGLFGAEAFVSQYKGLNDIGLIINFEARGNSGVSFTFEVSKQNGWMMLEFGKAVKHPFANSFAYEIYKVMPNDTDFSKFRSTGITGFNTAFIDGYSYYHSMADRIENMDVRSLQHHGNILIESLRHFGNLSLDNTKGEDMIFFNPIGSVMWLYPLSWDLPLMVLAFALWIGLVVVGLMRGRVKLSSGFIGLGLFIGFLVMSCLLTWGLTKLILWIYPYYSNFYSDNFYNATYYFWMIAGAVLLCFVLLFKKVSSKESQESILLGTILALLLIMVAIKVTLNTGAYLLYYPLLVLMLTQIILFLSNVKREQQPAIYGLAQLLFIAPAIFLWMPMVHVIFIAFSLILPFGAVLLLSFLAPFLLTTLGLSRSFGKHSAFVFPLALLFFGLFMAHRHSAYDKRHPLQSELMYAVDADSHAAYWISMQKKLDEWNGKYLSGSAKEQLEDFYPGSGNLFWKSKAPFQDASKGKIEILKDSLLEGKRHLKLLVLSDSTSHGIRFSFTNKVQLVSLNERMISKENSMEKEFIQFMAPPSRGITVELITEQNKPLEMRVIELRMGLPASLMVNPLPENFIYAPNYFSNSTHVKYSVKI